MTRQQILNLYNSLNKVGHLKGVKFAYAVSRNIDILQREIDAMQRSVNPTTEYQKFDKERIELAKEHSEKDDDGNPKVQGDKYVMKDQQAFEKAFEKLQKEYKDAISEREKQLNDYRDLLQEKMKDVELYTIPLDIVPEEISTEELHSIRAIIEDE